MSANQLVIVRIVEKLPKTKDEIQRLIIAELRTCAECENAWGIIVVPVVDDLGIATSDGVPLPSRPVGRPCL